MTSDNTEAIGEAADTINNLLGAMELPLSPRVHLDNLRTNLFGLMEKLREIYIAETGENPWL